MTVSMANMWPRIKPSQNVMPHLQRYQLHATIIQCVPGLEALYAAEMTRLWYWGGAHVLPCSKAEPSWRKEQLQSCRTRVGMWSCRHVVLKKKRSSPNPNQLCLLTGLPDSKGPQSGKRWAWIRSETCVSFLDSFFRRLLVLRTRSTSY